MIQVWDRIGGEFVEVDGMRVTKHFAITEALEVEKQGTYTITHIPTGAKWLSGITSLAAAKILAVVMQKQPIDWDVIRLDGGSFTPESMAELKKVGFVGRKLQDAWGSR